MLEKRHPARPGWEAGPVHYRWFESDRHLQAWAEKLEKQLKVDNSPPPKDGPGSRSIDDIWDEVVRTTNKQEAEKREKEEADEDAAKTKDLNSEELLVLQYIRDSGNMGIWIRDLKARTNLQQPTVRALRCLAPARRPRSDARACPVRPASLAASLSRSLTTAAPYAGDRSPRS